MCNIKAQTRRWADTIAPRTWIWKDIYSIGSTRHLRALLNDILCSRPRECSPLYGSQFLFNTQDNRLLGSDGYDNYQAPVDTTGNQLYNRRMWVSGELSYSSSPPKPGDVIICEEKIKSVRCLGPNAFVNISRYFTKGGVSVMTECRTLLYTNEPYRESSSNTCHRMKIYMHQRKIRFSASQLMRFNALSFNLHKIHYDADYCREEKLKDIVVSGPLLVSTMLEYLAIKYPGCLLKSFKYKNSEPCFINEDLGLSIEESAKNLIISIGKDGNSRCVGVVTL